MPLVRGERGLRLFELFLGVVELNLGADGFIDRFLTRATRSVSVFINVFWKAMLMSSRCKVAVFSRHLLVDVEQRVVS